MRLDTLNETQQVTFVYLLNVEKTSTPK